MYEIIDKYKSNTATSKSYGILLARMDKRNLVPKVSKHDDNHLRIEFSPKELSDELKNESVEALNQYQDVFKYSALRVWANFECFKKPN